MNSHDRPILRALDVQRVQHEGAAYYLLSDRMRVSQAQLYVPLHLGAVLARCTGELTVAGITRAIHAEIRTGYAADARTMNGDAQQSETLAAFDGAQVRAVVEALDRAGMLEGATFREMQAAALHDYRSQPFRPLALAGAGYPAQRRQMGRLLQDYLDAAGDVETTPVDWHRGVALLSPHIDYARGGQVYAQIWRRMAQAAREAEVALVFGTDHHGDDPFTLTRQHYRTPYGVLPTEQAITNALTDAIGAQGAFNGELRHRGEHSLELVLNWLHHMRAGEALPVVPILTGSLHRFIGNGNDPDTDAQINATLEVIHTVAQSKRTLIIASGDLAHVGTAFGGTPLDAAAIRAQTGEDMDLLQQMQSGGAEGFFNAIKRVRNRSNVCGVSPIYLAMRALRYSTGRTPTGHLTGYTVCPADEAGTSIVTIAGMHFQT